MVLSRNNLDFMPFLSSAIRACVQNYCCSAVNGNAKNLSMPSFTCVTEFARFFVKVSVKSTNEPFSCGKSLINWCQINNIKGKEVKRFSNCGFYLSISIICMCKCVSINAAAV